MSIQRVEIKGLEKLNKDLSALNSRFPKYVHDTTLKAVLYVHQEIPDYPPQPPNSTYRRTMTLGRTITTLQGKAPEALSRVEPLFGKIVGIVGTKLSYAPWVIDRNRQTKVHKRHGWWNLQDVVRGLRSGITKVYRDGLKKLFSDTFR
jgi:hypothetical protein